MKNLATTRSNTRKNCSLNKLQSEERKYRASTQKFSTWLSLDVCQVDSELADAKKVHNNMKERRIVIAGDHRNSETGTK